MGREPIHAAAEGRVRAIAILSLVTAVVFFFCALGVAESISQDPPRTRQMMILAAFMGFWVCSSVLSLVINLGLVERVRRITERRRQQASTGA